MTLPRQLWRLAAMLGYLLLGVVLTLSLLPDRHNGVPGERIQRVRQWWYRRLLRVLHVELRVEGKPPDVPALWVANHISWLDIPLLGALGPVGFLSKAEIRRWPVIGWLASATGTLFIERGNRQASQVAAQQIAEHVAAGHSILVFPEGKTTPGDTVQRFHARLFAPAIEQGLLVQPVALRYFHADGKVHDGVPFVDGQSFVGNLWRLLAAQRLVAGVVFTPPLDGRAFAERRPLAEQAHAAVLAAFESMAADGRRA